MTCDGLYKYQYDPWNRLATVKRAYKLSGGALTATCTVGTIAYDGTGRRISKAVTNSGDWDWTYHFYLDGQSVIETRDSSSNTISQHLWGAQYIDELIETRLNDDPGDAFRERGVGAEGCAEAGTAVHAESPRTTAEGEDQVRRRKRAMSPFLPVLRGTLIPQSEGPRTILIRS